MRKQTPIVTMHDRRVAEITAAKQEQARLAAGRRSAPCYDWADLKRIGRGVVQLEDAGPMHDPAPLRDGAWTGQRCFILGGGPSLKDFDASVLRGERVIAINRAYELCPDADVLFAMDVRLHDWITSGKLGVEAKERFAKFQGLKVWLDTEGGPGWPGVTFVRNRGTEGIPTSLVDGLYHGGNSGFGALGLAIALGASPIYLLGYDMHGDGQGGQAWFHAGYPEHQGERVYKDFREHFQAIAPELRARGIEVVNLTQGSSLKCFRGGRLAKILETREPRVRAGKWKLITHYTTGTGYVEEVEKLKASAAAVGLDLHAFPYPPQGSWRANLNFKSAAILAAFDRFPGCDIAYVDADARIQRYPKLFDELSAGGEYDIAARFRVYKDGTDGGSLLSGTLWFRNSGRGRRLVRRWHAIGISNQSIRHQHCLRLAIGELGLDGIYTWVYRLPAEYTMIFDENLGPNRPDPVIEHFQASRRLRPEVGFGGPLLDSSFTAADMRRKVERGGAL